MTAVIPAAGLGTRFLPATKTVPKEMLPIGSKPALQWIVEEAVAAGAERIVVVTSPDKPSLRAHFDADAAWHARLVRKPEIDAEMTRLEELGRRIAWVEQREQRGLGHAVLQAADAVREASRGEAVLILLGDALVSGCCAAREMARLSAAHGGASVIGCETVPWERVSRYGVLRLADDGSGRIADLVEKPSREEAPSNLVIAGRYLLDPAVFGFLATQTPGKGGEIQLTDAIRRMLPTHPAFAYAYPGRRHDIGNPAGYFEALAAFLQQP